uniref:Muscleblind-like protein n=1 Tax=Romanomermis culicivorax TaxID=13658 RepID=A0A915JJ55_ROMCU
MHGDKGTATLTTGSSGVMQSVPQPPATYLTPTTTANGLVGGILNVKDSRWLQLEVCREFQRGQCSRSDLECKFAHPPPHVEIQNGRVTACYDSIKGRCTRENPKCKYLHPPQHLKDQLLINGRNNLVLKNLLANQMTAQIAAPLSISPIAAMPGTSALIPNIAASYNPYAAYTFNAAALYPGLISTTGDPFAMASTGAWLHYGSEKSNCSASNVNASTKKPRDLDATSKELAEQAFTAANAAAVAAAAAHHQALVASCSPPNISYQQQQQQQQAYLTQLSAALAQPGQSRKRPMEQEQSSLSASSDALLMAAAALNSPVNKRAAVEKGGVPMMQPIYQTMPALGALPYQSFAVPGLTASYMVPATSCTSWKSGGGRDAILRSFGGNIFC